MRKASEENLTGEPTKQEDVGLNGEIDGKVTVFSEH